MPTEYFALVTSTQKKDEKKQKSKLTFWILEERKMKEYRVIGYTHAM